MGLERFQAKSNGCSLHGEKLSTRSIQCGRGSDKVTIVIGKSIARVERTCRKIQTWNCLVWWRMAFVICMFDRSSVLASYVRSAWYVLEFYSAFGVALQWESCEKHCRTDFSVDTHLKCWVNSLRLLTIDGAVKFRVNMAISILVQIASIQAI